MEEPPKEGEPLKLNGSAIMTYAASREEVLEQLKGDIYSKSGVWDLSKVCFVHVLLSVLRGLESFSCLVGSDISLQVRFPQGIGIAEVISSEAV